MMKVFRDRSSRQRIILALVTLAAIATPSVPLVAQQQPVPAAVSAPVAPVATAPAAELNRAFVRDQTWLGAVVYGPSFATTITSEALGWTAGYLVMAGGSFFAAAELSRDITITEPMRRLANGAAIHGAAGALVVGGLSNAGAKTTAGAIFLGSLGGTALALAAGKGVTDDEVAGALFGADAGSLVGLGTSRALGGSARGAAIAALAGMAIGAPLGGAYVASVPYRVTAGDVGTLWSSAAIGATAGYAAIANSRPSQATQSGVLLAGSALGLLAGDRWMVRRYDHTRADAQLVSLGAAVGGLMGAGVSVLTGASKDRFSANTAALSAAGALGGVVMAERFITPLADAGRKIGRIEVHPEGVLAAAMRTPGAHTLLQWTF